MTSDTPKLPEPTQRILPRDDTFAESLRGFGLTGILAILVIIFTGNMFVSKIVMIPAGAILVLLWAWRSNTPWHEIGYRKPASWTGTIVVGFITGITLKLLMKIIVMPLLGAEPVNQAYHFLAGNRALLPGAILTMGLTGFSEETVFRGFFFERLGKLFKPGITATITITKLTSVLFGLAHYEQGIFVVEQALLTGLIFGTIFAATGNIWIVIIAHAAFDLTALAMIYWDLENSLAHLVFK